MKTIYPNIWDACFLITVDNGGLNRNRSVEQIQTEFEAFIERVQKTESWNLVAINNWIGTLDRKSYGVLDSQFDILCCGEETERDALLNGSPIGTNDLLEKWFEEVC